MSDSVLVMMVLTVLIQQVLTNRSDTIPERQLTAVDQW